MIDPQAEAIKRLISMAKSGAQRRQLVPAVSQDLDSPPVGTLWIREDEQKAYLQTAPDTALLVASAETVQGGTEGSAIMDRSLDGVKLMLNTVTSDELASNSVTAAELADGAVDGTAFAALVDAVSSVKFYASTPTNPALTLDVDFDHTTDVLRVLRDGVQRFRVDETHVSIGQDLPQSAVSIQTSSTDNALRIRGSGGMILAERQNGSRLFSVDASGNLVVAGAISSLSGNSDTAGSLSINGALTVTNQANMLSGLSVTGRTDLRAEVDIDGQVTFNAEPTFPPDYSAKIGQAVHFRTSAAQENRLILEGVTALGVAEIQLGTGGPVLRGSLAQNDRMFIGADRVVTSAADGIRGNQIATDTITGGVGPGLGNIAAETITGYNIKNSSITSTELSPGAVVTAAIAQGAVGEVQLADGSVIDRVVASLGVGKLISGTLNADEIFMGPSGHIYLGPTYSSEILDERIQIDASGIRAYNSFNTPLAEFTPGGFTLRTGVDGARMSFSASSGLELYGTAGERNGYLSPLGQFQLDSVIDGARMRLDSGEGVQFFAGATKNLAYNPGFIGGAEHELAVAGEASNDQRHVFAGEYAVKFRSTNPNTTAPSYVDVPFKNTVGTGQSVVRTQVNYCPNPSAATTAANWIAGAPSSQTGTFGVALGFINDRAVWVVATAAGSAAVWAPLASTAGSVQWALSCSVRVSTAMNVTADILWYDVNNALIRTDVSQPFALKTNIVAQIGLVATAPSNATSFRLRTTASVVATDKLEMSNVLYERASGIGPYFDGYQAGYQWDGTPGNSTSSLIPVSALDSANNLVSIFIWSDVDAWTQIEGRDSTAGVSRGLSAAQKATANQWSRIAVQCSGKMDKVRLHYPSTDPARQSRITSTPVWWSGLQVEADKTIATPFCSGNEPGCRWEGLEAKSASIRDRDVIVTRISPTLGTHVSGAIVGGSLTSASFFAGRIFGTYIEGGTIKGNILTGNQINGDQILAGTIQGTSISARTIDASNIKTGTLTATEISAGTITGDKIAATTITTTNLAARSITADKLQTDMLISARIICGAAATGARVELTPGTGLQAFTSSGSRTFWIDSATGNLTATGKWTTGFSGERVEILTDGTQRFYGTGSDYAEIRNEVGILRFLSRADGSGRRSWIDFDPTGLNVYYGTVGGTIRSSFSSGQLYGILTAPVLGARVDTRFNDGSSNRFFFVHSNNGLPSGDYGDSVLHYGFHNSAADLNAPGQDCGIVWGNSRIFICDGAGSAGSRRSIEASQFVVGSARAIKFNEEPFSIRGGHKAADVVRAARVKKWQRRSDFERPERPAWKKSVPRLDAKGNPVLDASGHQVIDQVETEWTIPLQTPTYIGPIADDLWAIDPTLVDDRNGQPEDRGLSLMTVASLAWEAAAEAHEEIGELKAQVASLTARLNAPPGGGRP